MSTIETSAVPIVAASGGGADAWDVVAFLTFGGCGTTWIGGGADLVSGLACLALIQVLLLSFLTKPCFAATYWL